MHPGIFHHSLSKHQGRLSALIPICAGRAVNPSTVMEKADRGLGSHFTQDFHSGISNQGGSKGSVLDSADRFPQASSGLYHLTSQVKQGQCVLGSEQDLSMGANPAFAGSLGPGSQGQDGETGAPLTRISPVFPWVQEERRSCQRMGAPAECTQLPHRGKRLPVAPKQPLAPRILFYPLPLLAT